MFVVYDGEQDIPKTHRLTLSIQYQKTMQRSCKDKQKLFFIVKKGSQDERRVQTAQDELTKDT